MTEGKQTTTLIVRWVPLLTMDVLWEASWRRAILTMNSSATPIKEFNQDSPYEPHIHFFAYEAQWHKNIRRDGAIEAAIVTNPPDANSRIVLVACDKTYPKVNERHLQVLSNETLYNVGRQRHTIRAYTTDLLSSETEMLLSQSLMERGMVSPESPELDMQYKAQNQNLAFWDARGI
ncbi:hypothetical protein Q9R30_02990 [Arthrobacter sp. AB6]|uniref:hypothetical protein n=1 Tax=Arthrobacter sp. AB6 TaxID=2962570 RepID=UPI002880F884|nr:hypothetical protein [Arthrobacter sp. AB6]MDT0194316.1 hypothetical protein [Arthrobacter sp. AB6]